MKRLLAFMLLLMPAIAAAQTLPAYPVQVVAESAFIRVAPSVDSAQAASVFANDNLVAVGRNLDGTWLEVRRPAQQNRLGWIARDVLLVTFDVGRIPISDATTGLTGPEPVIDTGFAILTIEDVPLRTAPDRGAETLDVIPVFLTLPVVERTPNLQWLKVNFRGITGWIPQHLTSTSANLNAVPISPEYAGEPRYAAFTTITPEQQLAQIERLRGFVAPIDQAAADVAFYWQLMSQGETLECRPPAGNYADYAMTPQDIVELPELRQQARLLTQAVADINAAIEAMQPCGVYTQLQVRRAYARALSAQGIFRQILHRMENLEARIVDDPRRVAVTAGDS